jgi:2'-5' RNA ligase
VVWIGVSDDRALVELARDVESCCTALGFPPAERPFSAHLTVGRVRRELDRAARAALAREAESLGTVCQVEVGAVDLMRSDLSSRGPSYQVVASIPLAGSGGGTG